MSTEISVINKSTETFEVIKSAVNKMCDLIKPTYGPASNKVIIDKQIYRMAVDDGVQIARDLELPDPKENAVVKLVREAAVKTNDRVGDGTTSSLIILQALVNEVARRSKVDGRKIELELKRGLEEVKEQLKKSAKPIKTKEDLKKVALVSFDNEEIASMIADLYHKLGKEGIITIDKSPTMETIVELTDGLKIDNGYISPYMVTNPDRMESVLEKPYILLTDYRLTEVNDILPIMDKLVKENKRELVLIAENVEQSALATIIVNKMQGKFLVVAVNAPTGDDRTNFLEDLALLTGAKVFSEQKGDKLELAEITDLGKAERFICRREESIVVDPKGDKGQVMEATANLQKSIENEKDEKKKKQIAERLARFTNSLAVIKVGAATENEQKALKYKVEDAVHATKAALKNGVVCGAGLSLARLETSSPLLNEALKYPARQLMENMDLDESVAFALDEGHAMNVVTGECGPFMAIGVVDPVDVLLAGVESAVSIASILITSSGIIVEHEKNGDTE